MPKRKQYEQEVWQAFVEACGSRCNLCLKEGVALEKGHLLSEDDGGSSTFNNLIPVCRSCNASNREGLTQDLRPASWRDKFAKRLLAKFGIGLTFKSVVPTEKQSSEPNARLNGTQVTENTGLADWDLVTFVKANSLLPTDSHQLLLTEEKAAALVEEMIVAGRKSSLTAPPLMRRKGKLIRLARFNEIEFRAACENFFFQRPWEETGFGDAWAYLCDNYGMYVREGLEARKRKWEKWHADRKKQVEVDRMCRWSAFQRVLKAKEFPDMTDADRELIASAKGEERDVTAEETTKAEKLLDRESSYRYEQYKQRKEAAIRMLAKVDAFLAAVPHLTNDYNHLLAETYNMAGINRAKSVEDLNSWIEGIEEFFQILWNESEGPSVTDFLGQ